VQFCATVDPDVDSRKMQHTPNLSADKKQAGMS
jgi:hypothetical protein